MTIFHKTASTFRQGARTMPGEYYTSAEIFADERRVIFARQWNCVGRATRVGHKGDFVVSEIAGESLISVPARKFALGSLPPFLVGVIVVLGLAANGVYNLMAPVCMLAYGAAVVCGGAFSVRVVPVMGWYFMALGAFTFMLPESYGNLMMGISFGGLHIVFGAIIARRYGG